MFFDENENFEFDRHIMSNNRKEREIEANVYLDDHMVSAMTAGFLVLGIVGGLIATPILQNEYILVAFVISGLIGGFLSSQLYKNKKKKVLDWINTSSEEPHRVIRDFVHWEKGDLISTKHFLGEYLGITQDLRIILEPSSSFNAKEGPYILPVRYFYQHYNENKDLTKREGENIRGEVLNETSKYEEFLEAFNSEYEKLENGGEMEELLFSLDESHNEVKENLKLDLELGNRY